MSENETNPSNDGDGAHVTNNNYSNNDDSIDHVRRQKQILRKEIRSQLKLLSKEEIEQQSRAVWDQLHTMTIYQDAKSIGLFLSMPTGEIDTSYAVQHAIQCRKDIYIPQVGKNFELPDMELIQIQTLSSSSSSSTSSSSSSSQPGDSQDGAPSEPIYHNWPKNKWNIPEPPDNVIVKTAQPGDIDVLIVPGLAFDRYGHRLGQGKGYYDRFMARMCANAKSAPKLVAVALQCQFMSDHSNSSTDSDTARTIPVHQHDVSMNWIILPNEIIEITQ
jgi:5-formyltetrahydrofolate cyclo-ligase